MAPPGFSAIGNHFEGIQIAPYVFITKLPLLLICVQWLFKMNGDKKYDNRPSKFYNLKE